MIKEAQLLFQGDVCPRGALESLRQIRNDEFALRKTVLIESVQVRINFVLNAIKSLIFIFGSLEDQ